MSLARATGVFIGTDESTGVTIANNGRQALELALTIAGPNSSFVRTTRTSLVPSRSVMSFPS